MIFHEHIGRFDISVNVALIDKHLKTKKNLFENLNTFGFCKLMLGHLFPEIGVAKLEDDVGEVVSDLVSDHSNSVLGSDTIGDFDFAFEGFHENCVFVYFFHAHLLDGVELSVFSAPNFEYFSKSTFT